MIIIIIIIIIIILLPQTNYVTRQRLIFAAILCLQHMVYLLLFPISNISTYTLLLSQEYVQCPVWLLYILPLCRAFKIFWSGIFLIFLRLFQVTLLLLFSNFT